MVHPRHIRGLYSNQQIFVERWGRKEQRKGKRQAGRRGGWRVERLVHVMVSMGAAGPSACRAPVLSPPQPLPPTAQLFGPLARALSGLSSGPASSMWPLQMARENTADPIYILHFPFYHVFTEDDTWFNYFNQEINCIYSPRQFLRKGCDFLNIK